MINNSTNFKAFWILPLALLLWVPINLCAQDQAQIAGAVSHLSVNAEGNVECVIHQGDQIADDHHISTADVIQNTTATANRSINSNKKSGGGAQIEVTYFLADPTFLPQIFDAIDAFEAAVEVWSQQISTDQVIRVAAIFQQLPPGVLGSAGPSSIFANFDGMERDTWYVDAMADKLAGDDLSPGGFDIIARFSTVFPNWYFGTDGNTPPDDFDFPTVVLHELGHGLGFIGSMFVDNASGIGLWGFGSQGYPIIYDRLAHDRNGKQLLKQNKFANFSTELGDVLLDDPLVFRGPRIAKATNGKGARIFTTVTGMWMPGSSYSHLDFFTYAGSPESLMVPFLFRGFSLDNPGNITLAIFDDMGWNGKVNKPVKSANLVMEENTVFPITLFPNPVQGEFAVDLGDQAGKLSAAQLVDPLGRVYPLNFNYDRQQRLAIFAGVADNLKPGLYMLKLQLQRQETKLIRFIKD